MVRPHHHSKKSRGAISPLVIGIAFVSGFFLGHMHAQLTNKATETANLVRTDAPVTNDKCQRSSPTAKGAALPEVSPSSREYGKGWHSIEVFYGQADHLQRQLPSDQEWFSQARQDEAVSTLLKGKRNGFFVDLASNDATVLSNTYSLEQKFGWTGLCIEPNPMYWANLTYRDCQVVAAIVGNTRMEEVYFRFDAGDHSGIAGDGFDNGRKWQTKSLPKYTVTLKEILERFDAPKHIDYLSLDVEGAEEFIMKNFPLQEYTISLLTVERPKETLRTLFEQNGFKFLKRLTRWGETLWAHESVMDQLDMDKVEQFTPPPKKPKGEQTT